MTAKDLPILPHDDALPSEAAHLHVAGASLYVDDRPLQKGELYVGLLYSPHAYARIIELDAQEALALQGVACVLTSKDVAHNRFGAIMHDQPIIAQDVVKFVGEVVAVVGAESLALLKQALALIKVNYEPKPAILSIADAIKHRSFIGEPREIKVGNAYEALKTAPFTLSSQLTFKGAEHFYLENQAAIAYPQEDGAMEIHSSTQGPTETQMTVAEALGLPLSSVICITKRLGGGFGGKETQASLFAAYAALVAKATKRPARIVLSKDDDMIMTGKRNPYEVHYQVGFEKDGLLLALDCQFYGDGGAYADLSTSILERAMAHVDNAYYLANAHIRGIVCRTNYHPHTAFRGFGGPKGVGAIEHIMEAIAKVLGIDALDVRKRNCYQGGRITTHYQQKVENNLLPELFSTLEHRCHYRERRKQLDAWNQDSAKNPRGMSLTAIKFGISFTTRFLNQGHALVHIFRDGSVQVATGAVEMGQGVDMRIKTVVADAFGLPMHRITLLPTATDKSANTSPTAASSGTDLNATAAKNACEQIKQMLTSLFVQLQSIKRDLWPDKTAAFSSTPELAPKEGADAIFENGYVFTKNNAAGIPFAELINNAYLSRIPLSAYGFYKVPGLDFNKLTGQGNAFLYFTQGVACSEVELDRNSGAVKVLRTDILMDVGNPIHQGMDMGQIMGGFVQGLGWVLSENLYYKDGLLLSHSPSTYKIPSIHDMPRIFNVDLVHNLGNSCNIYSTKAAGEPPLMLCFSVWNAVKDALYYATNDIKNLQQPVPTTAENILRTLQPDIFNFWDTKAVTGS